MAQQSAARVLRREPVHLVGERVVPVCSCQTVENSVDSDGLFHQCEILFHQYHQWS